MTHIGFFLYMRANHPFGDGSLTPVNVRWPGSADADLDVPPDGPPGHIDTRFPPAMNIQHITLELIHHGAEVSLLRDLRRTGNRRTSARTTKPRVRVSQG